MRAQELHGFRNLLEAIEDYRMNISGMSPIFTDERIKQCREFLELRYKDWDICLSDRPYDYAVQALLYLVLQEKHWLKYKSIFGSQMDNTKIELGTKVRFATELIRDKQESKWNEKFIDTREGIIVGKRTVTNGKWVDGEHIIGEYPGEPEYYNYYQIEERLQIYIIAWKLSRKFCYVLCDKVEVL